jgi:hypothetical protein
LVVESLIDISLASPFLSLSLVDLHTDTS